MIDYDIIVPASTDNERLLDNFKRSHEKHRSTFAKDPIFFGQKHRVSCFDAKVRFARDILKTLKSEYIVGLDGFDTIVNKPLDENLFSYFSKNPNLEFMFGAEANCYPFPEDAPLFDKYSKTILKYVNGGLIVAKRESYLALLEEYLDGAKHPQSGELVLNGCDQRIFTLAYKDSLENKDDKAIIDSEAVVGIQMFTLEKDKDYSLDENKQLTFIETGNIPYFVHFNGDGMKEMHHFGIEYGK